MARSTQLWRASHGTDRLPTPARRPDYPPGVWQLLRAHVPPLPAGAPPPTCVVAAADRSKADQLAAATGFAAWPLLLGHKGEPGHLSSSAAGRCCLEQAAAAAVNMQVAPACAAAKAAATAVPPARPLQGADVFCFAGSLHLVDTHAALQARAASVCFVTKIRRQSSAWPYTALARQLGRCSLLAKCHICVPTTLLPSLGTGRPPPPAPQRPAAGTVHRPQLELPLCAGAGGAAGGGGAGWVAVQGRSSGLSEGRSWWRRP